MYNPCWFKFSCSCLWSEPCFGTSHWSSSEVWQEAQPWVRSAPRTEPCSVVIIFTFYREAGVIVQQLSQPDNVMICGTVKIVQAPATMQQYVKCDHSNREVRTPYSATRSTKTRLCRLCTAVTEVIYDNVRIMVKLNCCAKAAQVKKSHKVSKVC